MSTDYNVGVYLDPVPTGFGGYTGISIFNRSDKPISYFAEMSETSLFTTNNDPLPDTDAVDDNLYDTLFVASDINNVDTSISSVSLSLGAGESGNIYVAHKPFSTFWPTYQTTGIETAELSIVSQSSEGDLDSAITVKITGQRILDPVNPTKPGKFFAIESYNEKDGYTLDFKWQLLSGQAFVSGFKIDLCSDSSFSTHVADSPYDVQVAKNTESSKPQYLDYYNYGTRDFSYKINNLPTDSYMYARLIAVNGVNENSSYTYCTGFKPDDTNPIDNITYSGLHPSPGDNLGFGTDFLTINKGIDQEYEIDLAEILYEANNNSYDFTAYTGVVLNFYSNSENPDDNSRIDSSTKEVAAIRLKRPEGKNFTYSVNASNKFNLVLNFENISIAGYNGKGAEWNGNAVVNAEDGGPIFDFDNLNYGAKVFDYYINKDKDSIFYAGIGGTDAYKTNVTNVRAYLIDGEKNDSNQDDLSVYDQIPYPSNEEWEDAQGRGSNGKLIGTSGSSGGAGNFPSVYLGFSERNSTTFLPSSTFLFRFKTEGISDSAGVQKSTWNSSAGKAIQLKNSSNVLTVREAYGRKFYELTGAASQANAIQAFNNNSNDLPAFWGSSNGVDLRPNYTILVFALARKQLKNNNYVDTADEMLRKCSAIHKFVDSTVWGPTPSLSTGFWGKETAPFNPNNLIYNFYRSPFFSGTRASFVGSSLNTPDFVLPGSYQELSDGKEYSTTERDFFIYSNQMQVNSDSSTWVSKLTIDPYNINSREVASHFVFKDFNLAKTSSFETADNQKFTILQDSSGSGAYDELSAFELFFVKMHSTIGAYQANFVNTSNSSIEALKNETFINGKKVFEQSLALQQIKTVKRMLIQLNNNDPDSNNDTRTRLYLFDYIHGAAADVQKRNQASDSIMEYLTSYYAPLILKSSSGRLQVAKHDSGTNSQLSFGLPLSHNFLNLYSN
jgi:hypothetical protein